MIYHGRLRSRETVIRKRITLTSTASLAIRPLVPDDVPLAVELTVEEGWAVHPSWFELYLAHDPGGSWLAEDGDRGVAVVTSTRYAETAWVGNLLVRRQHRRRGIGERLMAHALERLAEAGVSTVRLEADPPGIGIYRRLGFVDELESLRFRREGGPVGGGGAAEPLLKDELASVLELDRAAFGDDRSRLLALLYDNAEAVWVHRRDGAVTGYLMLRRTMAGFQAGPFVAEGRETAAQLFDAALERTAGALVTIGLPASNHVGRELLTERGFVATVSSFRMVRGPRRGAGVPERVFAITNGAVG